MYTKKVKVESTVFKSLSEAAKFLACNPSYLSQVLSKGSNKIKGRNVEFVENVYTSNSSTVVSKRKCPVICETTGTTYPTIAAASRAAKANSWTMGLKMETTGKFIDDNGNVYIRTRPMNSRAGVNYINKHSNVIYKVKRKTKKAIEEALYHEKNESVSIYSILEKTAINLITKKHYKKAATICTTLNDLMEEGINA